MSDVTVRELDVLVEDLKGLELAKDAAAKVTTELNKKIAQVEGRIVHYLKDLDRDQYDSPHGKLTIRPKWRVNLPKGQNKLEFFEYLRERGIFEEYATVNSNSLNALYMADWQDAQKRGEGMTFTMPGIDAPTLFESLDFKLKKG